MSFKEWFRDFLGNAPMEPAAGSTVIAESAATAYFTMSALATAASYVSSAIAVSEWHVYKHHEEKRETFWYLLNVAPNSNQNATEFWSLVMKHLIFDGEALIVTIGNKLYVADSFDVDPRPTGQNVYTGIVIGDKYGTESIRQTFRASRAFYLRMNDQNVTALVNRALDAYSDMMAKAMVAYKQSCGTKYKVIKDRGGNGVLKDEESQRKALAANLKTFMENANAVYLETAGTHLETVKTDSNVEPSFITSMRKDIYDSAAIAMKVPESMLYGNMTNLSEVVDQFLTFAVDPVATLISDEFTAKHFSEYEICNGSRIHVDTSMVKHRDLFNSANAINSLISCGYKTIDDISVAFGQEPEGTDITSQRWMAQNIGRIEDVMTALSPGGGETNE